MIFYIGFISLPSLYNISYIWYTYILVYKSYRAIIHDSPRIRDDTRIYLYVDTFVCIPQIYNMLVNLSYIWQTLVYSCIYVYTLYSILRAVCGSGVTLRVFSFNTGCAPRPKAAHPPNHPPCNQNPPNLPNQQKIAQPQNASFLKTGPVRKFKRNLHSLLIANSAEESSLRSITSSPSQCLRFTWPNATVCHCDTI